jgi:molybdenum cofactor synthesis domain-containing protein
MLDILCRNVGAETTIIAPVGDDFDQLRLAIKTALDSDILVMTGGVSVGKYDLTKAALHEIGCEIYFDRLRLKPGKPMVFGKLKNTLVFALPGNPASAAVTFYLFVRQAILQKQSANETGLRRGQAVLTRSARSANERDTYLPAVLHTGKEGQLFATPLKFGGSSDMVGFAKAEALIEIPRGKLFDEGDVVAIHWL